MFWKRKHERDWEQEFWQAVRWQIHEENSLRISFTLKNLSPIVAMMVAEDPESDWEQVKKVWVDHE